MKFFYKTALLIIFVAFVISGCSPKTPTAEKIVAIPGSEITETTKPSSTPLPTKTIQPTSTSSSTQEPTETNTFTITPSVTSSLTHQPTEDFFKDASVLNVGYLGNSLLLIVIEAKDDLSGEYIASIGDDEFQCEILAEYPNRIYCNGSTTKVGQQVIFEIFSIQNQEPVFQVEIIVPKISTSTPKPSDGGNNPKETEEEHSCEPWPECADDPEPSPES